MIQNREYTIRKADLTSHHDLPEAIEQVAGERLLRWYVSKITPDALIIEATLCHEPLPPSGTSVLTQHFPGKSAVLNLIPTGIGCESGGYAGDAGPITALLAASADYLITNPNAVNASNSIFLEPNVLYTEGSAIDLFARGLVNLHVPYSNKVGLIIEQCEPHQVETVFNVLNTVRAVYGVDIEEYVITSEPIGGRCVQNPSGAYVGTLDNPSTLFAACETLLQRGVTAIAVTSNIQDLPAEEYARHFSGEHPNPVGGTEAIISHLITRKYRVPAAHAPMINIKQLALSHRIVDARGAGEMASESGLACILIGLRRAPQLAVTPGTRIADILNLNNLLAVVAPASSLGGIPMFYAQRHHIPLIAVRSNHTVLDITPERLMLPNVIPAHSYAEAAGLILALKRGLSIPSISRPLPTLRPTTVPAQSPLPAPHA